MRFAKSCYAKSLEKSFNDKPAEAWKSLKSVLMLNSNDAGCQFDANELNQFYNRFDKPFDCCTVVLPDICDTSDFFSIDDVYFVLKSTNTRKSQGPDNIPPKLLKAAARVIAKPVQTIYNNSIRLATFPQCWKSANIKPIPKCKAPQHIKDFRPISHTSTLAKCFERLTVKYFQPLVTDTRQFAYKQNNSTEDAFILLMDTISEHLDLNAQNYVRGVFIDFSSAFNTISPTILIEKLKQTDLHPNLINWIYSYLCNRTQRVISQINTSDWITSSTGSPQGCVLSPILFSIYVDEMGKSETTNSVSFIKYADDTLVLEKLYHHSTSSMQNVMTTLHSWCNERDLILNTTKTKEILFTNTKHNPDPPEITINDTPLERVEAYKYLGTTITNKLKFHRNTELLIKNARKKLFIMRKLRFLGTSDQLALTCYRTFIESGMLHHLTAIYSHLSEKEKGDLMYITTIASKLANTTLPSIKTTVAGRVKTKVLRMVTSSQSPVLTLDTLPSGRYRTLKHRTNLRKLCFRNVAAKVLNDIFF